MRISDWSSDVCSSDLVGRAFYEQCEVMLGGVEAAEAAAAEAYAEPYGLVRVSCPQGLIQNLVGEMLPRFMEAYPKVRVQLKVINRRADFVDDAIDVALRARSSPDQDSRSEEHTSELQSLMR